MMMLLCLLQSQNIRFALDEITTRTEMNSFTRNEKRSIGKSTKTKVVYLLFLKKDIDTKSADFVYKAFF